MLRRTGLLLAVLVAVMGIVLPASVATADPYCGITWGSGAKTASPTTTGEMVGLRAGEHDCYDRLVFDIDGSANGFWVSYVDTVTEDGSGTPIALRGGARLSISVHAPAYDESFTPTYTYANRSELVNVNGYQTFRQVAWAGSWEGTTTVGLGVRAHLPFRVFTLPGRIVIDVAHHW
ncbi:AMIN-like domain-containing (lipo)protein [Actinophytocola sediminis]